MGTAIIVHLNCMAAGGHKLSDEQWEALRPSTHSFDVLWDSICELFSRVPDDYTD